MDIEGLAYKTLEELITFVKTSGPFIWQATYKKVVADAYTDIVWTILAFIVFLILFILTLKLIKFEEDEGFDGMSIVSGFFALCSLITTLSFGNSVFRTFYTADFLVLKELLRLIK